MRFVIFPSVKNGQWYWRAVSRNNQVIATGAEGYTRRRDAIRAVDRFVDGLQGKEVVWPSARGRTVADVD